MDNPFEKVLNRLREKGWQKGWFGDENGPNCLVGAAQHLSDLSGGWAAVVEGMDEILIQQYPERRSGNLCEVPNFNDHPDTTFGDVERVLEKAAIKWEEERVMRDE